jgi:hypothetical protein
MDASPNITSITPLNGHPLVATSNSPRKLFCRTADVLVRPVLLEPVGRTGSHRIRATFAGETEFVFTNPDTGTRYTDIKKSFSAACREAGITNFTFHDLRHTFGTRLADAGVDVAKIRSDGSRFDCDNDALHFTQPIKERERSLSCQSIDSRDKNDVTSLSQKEKRQAQRFMGTCRKSLENNGEPSRARTCDPLIKSQLLYQLSYRPTAEENYTFVN